MVSWRNTLRCGRNNGFVSRVQYTAHDIVYSVCFSKSTVYAFTYKPATYISFLFHFGYNNAVGAFTTHDIVYSVFCFSKSTVYAFTYKPATYISFIFHFEYNNAVGAFTTHDIVYSASRTKKNTIQTMNSPKLTSALYAQLGEHFDEWFREVSPCYNAMHSKFDYADDERISFDRLQAEYSTRLKITDVNLSKHW